MWRFILPVMLTLLGHISCVPEPTALPTETAIATLERDEQPPLYQLLYDAPTLPLSQKLQQKVRILIWLRHMELAPTQLARLEELRVLAEIRRDRIADAEREAAHRFEPIENTLYLRIWSALEAGAAIDDPVLGEITEEFREFRAGGERERELLKLRLQGIRALLEAQHLFLDTLSPRQEALLADAVFFLRNRLDPVGNPGDFRALVGSIYEAGQYAVLTRGTSQWARSPLNIGALWTDEPPLEGGALHEARREVILYLILLEPSLAPAITAAQNLGTTNTKPAQTTD
jgi:hypothetical protein